MISSSVCFCRQLRQELLTLQCTTATLFTIVRVTTLSYRIVTQYKKLLFCKQRWRFANEVLSKVLHRTVRLPSTPAAANKNTLEMFDHHDMRMLWKLIFGLFTFRITLWNVECVCVWTPVACHRASSSTYLDLNGDARGRMEPKSDDNTSILHSCHIFLQHLHLKDLLKVWKLPSPSPMGQQLYSCYGNMTCLIFCSKYLLRMDGQVCLKKTIKTDKHERPLRSFASIASIAIRACLTVRLYFLRYEIENGLSIAQ